MTAAIYRVQGLAYTKRVLLQVMFWMLWGDFCLTIMESLIPGVVPLQLRCVGASDAWIGLIASSLPAFIGILLNPVVGLQSDRHRGVLGRRRPFLLWSIGPVCAALLLLGVAGPVGRWMHLELTPFLGNGLTAAACTIGWISLAMVVFVVCNTYILLVYQFLFADVIPLGVMGRFIGLYRAVGAFGAFAFNRWLLGWVEGHTFHVYALAAILYGSAFGLLVWRVKEGSYPPPESRRSRGPRAIIQTYLRECYSHRFYLNIYLVPFFYWSALVPFQTFIVFFATKAGQPGYAPGVGFSLTEFGHIRGWTFLVQIPIFTLTGPLLDRFHPLRVIMVGALFTSLGYFCCYGFIRGESSLLTWWLVTQIAAAVFLSAYLALFPRLLPREKYGQFFSANSIFGFVGVLFSPVLCGALLEYVRDYRLLLLWCGVFTLLSFAATVGLFRQWKRLGGDLGYSPPGHPGAPAPVAVGPA